MDNHLGNNEIFYPSWSQMFSPHPHLIVKFPVGHISWWLVTKKNNKRRVLVRCVIPSPLPPPLIFVWLECAQCRWRSHPARRPSVTQPPSHCKPRRSTAPVPRLFPLVNSSFGNNENSAIARKCALGRPSRYNRVSLYIVKLYQSCTFDIYHIHGF